MHEKSLTVGLAALLLASAPLAAQIDQAMLDKVKAEILPVVSKATAVDLSKLTIRLAERDEIRKLLDTELKLTAKVMGQSEGQRRLMARTTSRLLLGKFSLTSKELLLCAENFAWQAKVLKKPALAEIGAFRAVMIHECIHAADEKRWSWAARFLEAKSPAEINAFSAVVEGHAQLITAKICKENGWQKGFETFTSVIGMPSPNADIGQRMIAEVVSANVLASYVDGQRFMAYLENAKGKDGPAMAFKKPPTDFEAVLNPQWYLDPTKRPKTIYKFKKPLQQFVKQHSADEWNNRPVTLTTPQIRAAMSLLEKTEVDRLVAHLKQNRMMVLTDKKNPNDRMIIAGLYEFDSAEEARFFVAASEKLSRTKDEKMKTGQIKILKASYEPMREAKARGLFVLKTVGFAGQKIPVTSILAARGSVGVELLYSNEKVDAETAKKIARSLLTLSFDGNKSPAKDEAPKKVGK